jgi:hypothetical protein
MTEIPRFAWFTTIYKFVLRRRRTNLSRVRLYPSDVATTMRAIILEKNQKRAVAGGSSSVLVPYLFLVESQRDWKSHGIAESSSYLRIVSPSSSSFYLHLHLHLHLRFIFIFIIVVVMNGRGDLNGLVPAHVTRLSLRILHSSVG